MTNEALAIEALRLALSYHVDASDDEVLVSAKRFYGFLSSSGDSTQQVGLSQGPASLASGQIGGDDDRFPLRTRTSEGGAGMSEVEPTPVILSRCRFIEADGTIHEASNVRADSAATDHAEEASEPAKDVEP